MKHKVSSLVGLLALVVMVFGCGGETTGDQTTSTTATTASTSSTSSTAGSTTSTSSTSGGGAPVVRDIAYVDPSRSQVATCNVNGGNNSTVSSAERSVSSVKMSPDGQWIAWNGYDSTSTYRVYISKVDGTSKRQISLGSEYIPQPASTLGAIAFSKDSTNVFYLSQDRTTSPIAYRVMRCSVVSGTSVKIFSTTSQTITEISTKVGNNPVLITMRAVSNNGTSTYDDIYSIGSDGSNLVNLSNSAGTDNFPVASPDGSTIAFHSLRSGADCVYTMTSTGANQLRLSKPQNLTGLDGADIPFNFNSTGTKIAYSSVRKFIVGVRIINASGGGDVLAASSGDLPKFAFEGSICYLGGSALYRVSSSGGNPVAIVGSRPYTYDLR